MACTNDAGTAPADWVISTNSTQAAPLPPALLGQYDLSGALLHYPDVPGLVDAMGAAGFSEWRVGVGRWEMATRLLPTLTDGTSCAAALQPFPADAKASGSDVDLVADRDWFNDDGNPVSEAMTSDDSRYSLDYLRSVLDAATAFGAAPYLNLDHMPRALSASRDFVRAGTPAGVTDPCLATWVNHVSNVRPADDSVFAAAVVGLMQRLDRPISYLEIWNEPDLAYAWDPSFEAPNSLDQFFNMAFTTLARLDAWRSSTSNPLRIGLGSFAHPQVAVSVLQALDAAAAAAPVDFLSFHSYNNDPAVIIQDLNTVAAARDASSRYHDIELSLSEWGPDLANPSSADTMDRPLLMTSVIAAAAALNFVHAHHTIFYDFYAGLTYGLIDHDGNPRPLHRAYTLLHALFAPGSDRLPIAGAPDGQLDDGAALVSRDGAGQIRALLVNRGAHSHSARIELDGRALTPTSLLSFDDPWQPPHAISPPLIVPAQALVLVELQ